MIGQPVARLGCTFTDESRAPLSAENDLVRRILFSGRAMTDLVIGIHHPGKDEPIWVLVHAYPEVRHVAPPLAGRRDCSSTSPTGGDLKPKCAQTGN
jgi:hypothetical protein